MAEQILHGGSALDRSTELAFESTWVAYERTMLAWVRTATSLITFGFSVFKFFEILKAVGGPKSRLIGAREFGVLLVDIGLASQALATIEYGQNIRLLEAEYQGRLR